MSEMRVDHWHRVKLPGELWVLEEKADIELICGVRLAIFG
jgi:hypothetical protein